MFWDSQIFGVLVGGVVAAGTATVLEVAQRRAQRDTDARSLRQATHADAISAAYAVREAVIRLFVVTDFDLARTPSNRRAELAADRKAAFDDYEVVGRRLGELIHLANAFGAPGVVAALREFGSVTGFYVATYLQTPQDHRPDLKDLENVMEYLLASLAEEARRDADAGRKVAKSGAASVDGRLSWLAVLEQVSAQVTADGNGTPERSAPDQDTPN